jgi:hypothetical protein
MLAVITLAKVKNNTKCTPKDMIEIYDQIYFELTRCTFKHREMQMNPKYALCNTRELKIWNFVTNGNVATLYSTAICFNY